MQSMTGFGRGSASAGPVGVSVEVSGVNRKQLDVATTLPREFGALETVVRELVGACIVRGRVNVTVSVSAGGAAAASAIDAGLANAYYAAMRKLQREIGAPGEVTIETVLRAPGVLRPVEATLKIREIEAALRIALEQALKRFVAMRMREGRHLAADVGRRVTAIATAVREIRKLLPVAVARYRETLLTRLRAAGVSAGDADDRLLKEIALFAERSDVSEELARIESHLGQVRASLASREPMGRQLEFIVQELAREFNTLGSKSQDVGISRATLECKAEVEKMREQVQNIE